MEMELKWNGNENAIKWIELDPVYHHTSTIKKYRFNLIFILTFFK